MTHLFVFDNSLAVCILDATSNSIPYLYLNCRVDKNTDYKERIFKNWKNGVGGLVRRSHDVIYPWEKFKFKYIFFDTSKICLMSFK